jgi:hypothetical protein
MSKNAILGHDGHHVFTSNYLEKLQNDRGINAPISGRDMMGVGDGCDRVEGLAARC